MENFFNWIAKPLPNDEVIIWFNVHNMLYERIELYGDIFKTLHHIIRDTYMGDDFDAPNETKISITKKDQELHFDWCWKKMISDFKKENVIITEIGEHKDYLMSFYVDTFYNQSESRVKNSIPKFLNEIFDLFKPFSKSDLDMITELYKLLEKNVK